MGSRRRSIAVLLMAALGAASCSDGPSASATEPELVSEPAGTTTLITTSTTTSTTMPPATTTTEPAPFFSATVATATEEGLGSSWRSACPVPVAELRLLTVTHWNDVGVTVDGEIVVHADYADDIVGVFERLFDARFPIHSLVPITAFDSSDDASMVANNSSGFNCREVAGQSGVWSQHSFGGAVDINPLINPWVRGSRVDPPEGERYLDRDPTITGLIVAGDVVTEAFAGIGWIWGGDWTSTIDYQHFSHNGQ